MTQQRAKRLSNFHYDNSNMISAKASRFRSFKNESSLTLYFQIIKQLFTYYYREVFYNDGHFTREHNHQTLPRDVIETAPITYCNRGKANPKPFYQLYSSGNEIFYFMSSVFDVSHPDDIISPNYCDI
ncbi:Transposon Tf2-1 polyprotein [Fusarium oxysporum f. sp. albedinis]|nr:Transposon Tf2-1 polyprotein [Fusarium oxysporum f. sp. albedinis]